MMTNHKAASTTVVFIAFAVLAMSAMAGGNLLDNGSFDDPRDPLTGWKSEYTSHLQRAYADNHEYVSVVDRVSGRRNVLKLYCDERKFFNEGVKVDSYPIEFEPGQRFRLTARAKSTGPQCRFLVQGYRWRPDVEPHENPKYEDLRRVYRFGLLYFNDPETGDHSRVPQNGRWRRGSLIFPDRQQTDLGRRFLEQVDFLIVHILAVRGGAGAVYVDDVRLTRIR